MEKQRTLATSSSLTGTSLHTGEQVTLTDQIFPDPSSTGVAAFAEGGTATLDRMQAWQLKSIWP